METLERLRAIMAIEPSDTTPSDLARWFRDRPDSADRAIGRRYVLDHLPAWPLTARLAIARELWTLHLDDDTAWHRVQRARHLAADDPERTLQLLAADDDPPELAVALAAWLIQQDTHASTPALHALTTLIDPDADDLAFDALRAWLLTRGRDAFDTALRATDELATWTAPDDVTSVRDLHGLSLHTLANTILQNAGLPLAPHPPRTPPWTPDERFEHLPNTARRFLDPKALRDLELKAMMRAHLAARTNP